MPPSLIELKKTKDFYQCRRARPRKRDYADIVAKHPANSQPQSAAAVFLGRVCATASELEDGIELIYGEIDSLLSKGLFVQVDEVLDAVEVSALPSVHLLAFASITYAAKDSLRSRSGFVTRLRKHLEVVAPDRVEGLLTGLE